MLIKEEALQAIRTPAWMKVNVKPHSLRRQLSKEGLNGPGIIDCLGLGSKSFISQELVRILSRGPEISHMYSILFLIICIRARYTVYNNAGTSQYQISRQVMVVPKAVFAKASLAWP